jgi:hypothetical protein
MYAAVAAQHQLRVCLSATKECPAPSALIRSTHAHDSSHALKVAALRLQRQQQLGHAWHYN